MNFKKLGIVLALAMCAPLVGCGDDDSTVGGDGGGDTGGDDDDDNASCDTGNPHFFAVSRFTLGTIDQGFNLDGDTTVQATDAPNMMAGCGVGDGVNGVDNSLGPVLAGLLPVAMIDIGALVTDGSLLILADLQNVDDFTNDPCVNLDLLLGLVPGDGTPMSAGGALTAGQTFDVNSASYDASNMAKISTQGTITNGVLSVGPTTIGLNLPTMNGSIALSISNARLQMNVSATGFTNGVLGGELVVADIIAAVEGAMPGYGALVMGAIDDYRDLNPAGSCDKISIALTFDGVTAVQGATRAAPAPMN